MSTEETTADKEKEEAEPDVHFEPVVELAPVELKTNEEDETELFRMRAKLFRFDCSSQSPEWKERGVGDVKFMEHKSKDRSVRLVMRRDKTHKICANHFITPDMKLTPSSGSDRAWVWTVQADFADEEAKVEQLAIRFKNRENALQFKEQFERCQERAVNSETDDLTSDLKTLNLEEEEEEEKGEETPTPAQTEEEKTGTTTSEDPVPQ